MNNWQSLTVQERQQLIQNISYQTGLSPHAIEKDWWVTMALKALFQTSCSDFLLFKGGTSLSKGWNLIERFSEDIDLAIDRSFFGMEGELSKKARTELRKKSCHFIKNDLAAELDKCLHELDIVDYQIIVLESTVSDADPQELFIAYTSLFPKIEYIPSQVKIEMSCRSMREPFETVSIHSVIADSYPNEDFSDPAFELNIVSPKRTFLEKIFLLHEEFQLHRPHANRMSRHLYDVEKLMKTEFAEQALQDTELYVSIVKHRVAFNKWQDVDYRRHHPSMIRIVPPSSVEKEWESDYKNMQGLFIYGDSLSYKQLIKRLSELEEQLHDITIDDEFFLMG